MGHTVPLRKVELSKPATRSRIKRESTPAMIGLLRRTQKTDLILCLVSGGASALLSCPVVGLSLQDKQQTTQALLNCGARIQEVNAIRKHISRVKGGRLAKLAHSSTVLSLILSDVIDDSMDNIGSGPTKPLKPLRLLSIIDRYGLEK
jgi:hydroxypyruvate reductase